MKKSILFTALLLALACTSKAQSYFPAKFSSTWDTFAPQRFGWCQERIDSLYNLLDNGKTKGFILLKDGKIVLEQYFNGHTKDSSWYWASAGKSLTAFMVGLAQEQGKLNINDSSSKYQGTGWTSLTPSQEAAITIKNQLSMTSGLNDALADCTLPSCLVYKAAAGSRWAYHNAPYTLLDKVVENATGQSYNLYFQQQITAKTGQTGLWIKNGYNNIMFSTTRSMARYGLLIQNKGIWNGDTIMHDTNYFNSMVNTSQNINNSYGYLWWLNGKSSYMLPSTQLVFNGSLVPNAPNDMFAGMGKNGQYCCVIPSQKMVVIRMGDSPDSSLVPTDFINKMFEKINELSCSVSIPKIEQSGLKVYPNPNEGNFVINSKNAQTIQIYNINGQLCNAFDVEVGNNYIDIRNFGKGIYLLKSSSGVEKLLVE